VKETGRNVDSVKQFENHRLLAGTTLTLSICMMGNDKSEVDTLLQNQT
jgi:hypothetical protein